MAQFDAYPNPVKELRDSHPYVLSIQSAFLQRPVAVITIALARPTAASPASTTLNPRLEVAGESLILETLAITSFEPGDLRHPVANLQSQAQPIWDALEYALHGY